MDTLLSLRGIQCTEPEDTREPSLSGHLAQRFAELILTDKYVTAYLISAWKKNRKREEDKTCFYNSGLVQSLFFPCSVPLSEQRSITS